MPRPSAEPAKYDRAVEWFRARVPMTDDEFAKLDAHAAEQAFWIGNVAQLDVVDQVYSAVDDALRDGTTLDDFKDEVADELYQAWGEPDANRVETIFRTWVQRSYQAGRFAEQTDEDVVQAPEDTQGTVLPASSAALDTARRSDRTCADASR
ncbi:MAG TPA: hypothetical protein VF785_04740, partial [Gemmatimonadaceae bacterium]